MKSHANIPSRFPLDRPLEEDTGLWWVLRCRPNREYRMARYLMQREISYFLPMYNRKIRIGAFKRNSVTRAPLFTGYVCFALDRNQHNLLYQTHDFLRIIEVREQNSFVRELQSVARVVKTDEQLLVKPTVLEGKRAVIISGPLKGLEGVIVRRGRNRQFAITVKMFNRSVIMNGNPSTDIEILR